MKTIRLLTLILSTAFVFQFSNLFAAIDGPSASSNYNSNKIYAELAPTTPVVATFEDDATLTDYAGLAPVIPMEADFNDNDIIQTFDFRTLAPTAPSEADFSDIL